MKRLLIIGASVLRLPAIMKAKEMGLCVAVEYARLRSVRYESKPNKNSI